MCLNMFNYKTKERGMEVKVKVFLDLDDTLADTSKEIERRFSYKNYGINTPIVKKNVRLLKDLWIWQKIKKNPEFWTEIPKREMAYEIYEEALKIAKSPKNIYILTALPKLIFKKDSLRFKMAAQNKIKWVQKHFKEIEEENILVVHAIEKKNYAKDKENKFVLFDDSLKNVKEWKNSGGIAYLVTKKGFMKI